MEESEINKAQVSGKLGRILNSVWFAWAIPKN